MSDWSLVCKPRVFQRDKRWYVSLIHPSIEFMFASFDDALIYAGYLVSTRLDGLTPLDIPLLDEWRAS